MSRTTKRLQWAWRLTSFEFRFALWLIHALPKHHQARNEMAECILRIRNANRQTKETNRAN